MSINNKFKINFDNISEKLKDTENQDPEIKFEKLNNNVKTIKIIRENEIEEIKVLFGKIDGEFQVKTEPYNMVIEDAVGNMLDDIGKWDYEYLKEAIVFKETNVAVGL